MQVHADTIVYVRRRLVALHHAGSGVLPIERAAISWDWLERALPDRPLRRGFFGAWATPLPSGRMAVMRICAAGPMPVGVSWSVGVLLLERTAYEWLLERISAALYDEQAWSIEGLSAMQSKLPEWSSGREIAPNVEIARRISSGEQVLVRARSEVESVSPVLAQLQALGHAILGDRAWSVGLPVACPSAALALVCPSDTPVVLQSRVAPQPPRPVLAMHGPTTLRPNRSTSESELAGQTTSEVEIVSLDAEGAALPGYRIEPMHRAHRNWVPAACAALMSGALAFAWRILTT
jgi:hypothetical protein